REREDRAPADLGVDPDRAAVQLDEAPAQRQPEAGALALPRLVPRLPKLLEDGRLLPGRDPDPRVSHRNFDLVVRSPRGHRDRAASGVNLTAFVSRLNTTCLTFRSSASTQPTSPSTSSDSAIP